MVKYCARFFVVVLIFVSFTQISDAFFGRSIFGGKITNTKANKVEEYENDGYDCYVNGSTIEIKPIKGPTSYFIPSGVRAKSKNSIRINQQIIGSYKGKDTTITCTKNKEEEKKTFDLPTINIFNVSQR